MADAYATLLERIKDIGKLDAIDALLEWDQDTCMPAKGVAVRAELSAFVAAMRHERRSSSEIGDLLDELADRKDGDPVRETNIRETRRRYQRAVRVPTELVRKLAHTSALAKEAWVRARRQNDFALFSPLLAELIELKRQQAEALGYAREPYDALLDEFEPGATTAEVAALFDELHGMLVPFVRAIANAPRQPDVSILRRRYPRAAQESLARRIAAKMGFDFEAGRLDVSAHPFCLAMGSGDVRMTTRYDENFLPSALFGVMHEAGHGLYEQGISAEHVFTPMGSYASLGIHESQSRLWENMVGRSRPFWQCHFAAARDAFGEALKDVSLDAFVAAINAVAPSLIRVEADEVTYNLHIVMRFELERDILNRRLEVADIPEAWNRKLADLVGVTPPDNATGCLQDIHWSMGAFGYFPTYTLGNLYAAQFFAAAQQAIGNLEEEIAAGPMAALLEWLRANVHRHGMRYTANQLCERATGWPLAVAPFMQYLQGKYRPLYGL